MLPGGHAVGRAEGARDGDHRGGREDPPRPLRRRLGYLDFAGNADFAIAIRTALMRDGTAYVQAGGGVVADSNGQYEYTEAANKAKAVLNAIAAAETITPASIAARR